MQDKKLFQVKQVPVPSDNFIKSQEKYKEVLSYKKVTSKRIGRYPKAQY